jgi:GH18 family chitinase
MGYDFYGSWSSTAGPTAPLSSSSPYNIFNTINQEYANESYFYPNKLILGVPYFGPHWTTTTPNEGSTTIAFQNSKRFRDAEVEASNYGLKWSTTFQNSWYSYQSGSTYHQVWYDNAQSMGLKYDLAIEENLKGIGMWALGYDGSRDELWDLIAEKFTIPVSVENSEFLPKNYILKQNYPNPFNPATTIEYSIPNVVDGKNSITRNVSLSIFDMLGREIVTLVNEDKAPGNYKIQFDASDLSSGIYYYTLNVFSGGSNNFMQTKKMLVLK